jgi:hypothetical protein
VRRAWRPAAGARRDAGLDGRGAPAGPRPDAERLQTALFEDERIEVPITIFPVRAAVEAGGGPEQALVRISAQRYNHQDEYAHLAESLARRLRGPASPRALLGRLRKT